MMDIDFRSDTLTKPDAAMRKAMAEAEVGDDFYREDPTVSELEHLSAEMLGKEAALFVLSGTMGNAVSVKAQLPHGSGAIVSANAHIQINEAGHLATLCGVTATALATPRGRFDLEALEIRLDAGARRTVLNPGLRMICVENTHNAEGGRCLGSPYLTELAALAHRRHVIIHMDGARLFNAATALGESPACLARSADSVTFCLSKGLGAPGGSIVAGSREFVEEARHWRQMLGGGMRQAGLLAAAGLHALRNNVERLVEDHDNARRLARGLRELGLRVDEVESNIVMAHVPAEMMAAADFFRMMVEAGIRTLPPKGTRMRFVTHKDVDAAAVDRAIELIAAIGKSRPMKVAV